MWKSLLETQRAAVWYILLVICMPLITLVVLGLITLWQNDWLILVSVVWLLVTLTGYTLYRLWPSRIAEQHTKLGPTNDSTLQDLSRSSTSTADNLPIDSNLDANLPLRLDERTDWTALDKRVWLRAVESVELTLNQQPHWNDLPELCLELLTTISEYYHVENQLLITTRSEKSAKNSDEMYNFTLPEVLLVVSITSSRYRQLVLNYIPFADRVKMSSLLKLYARQSQIKTGAKWINTIRRTTRLANPLTAVTAEIRDQFTNHIFTNLSDKVQKDLKRLLLQELVQVGMDLYSGRLKSSVEELSEYRSSNYSEDTGNRVIPIEPLRIVLVGQISSGKSSLINALVNRLDAETDILPSTDSTTVHSPHGFNQDTGENANPSELLHLIDTVGLTDNRESQDSLVDIARQADLLIWVARANQPGRASDATLYKALQDTFEQQPMRRRAPMLLVVTHVDQLKPKAIWQPPYDLDSNVAKAVSIRHAIESCKQQIGLPQSTPAIPVCLATSIDPYNVDNVSAQITLLQADAMQTQLNRRRTERDSGNSTWRDRWTQASKLGTVTGKVLVRSVLGESSE